jgi:hypothetical protein
MKIEDIRMGMTVVFGRPNGEKTRGVVRRISAKSVAVETVEARGTNGRSAPGQKWRVHPSLIQPADVT